MKINQTTTIAQTFKTITFTLFLYKYIFIQEEMYITNPVAFTDIISLQTDRFTQYIHHHYLDDRVFL